MKGSHTVPGEDIKKNVKTPYNYYCDIHFKFRLSFLAQVHS